MDYTALNYAKREIRLLTVRSGSAEDPIDCGLTNVSLIDRPTYFALSYVWGNPNERAPITIEGAVVQVTKKLWLALRSLRSETEDLIIWVDAVCINQIDVVERNEQVAMMGNIYASATSVLVWIGEADDSSDVAFDLMPGIVDGTVDPHAHSETGGFYFGLSGRPWFSRNVSWSTFVGAWKVIAKRLFSELGQVRYLDTMVGTDNIEVLSKIKLDLLDDLRRQVRGKYGCSLRQLLIFSRTSEASRAEDRIYALLAMLSKNDHASIDIDYRKPVSVIYAEAMAHIFSAGSGPDFISGMWLPNPGSQIPDLPSWVPDFSAQTAEKTTVPIPLAFRPPHPRTVSGPGADAINGIVHADMKTLEIRALSVDIVQDVLLFDQSIDVCIRQLPEVEAMAARAIEREMSIGEEQQPFYEHYRRSEPLWRTLVSDKRRSSGYDVAPVSYEAGFRALLSSAKGGEHTLPSDEDEDPALPVSEYRQALQEHLPRRTFFTTQNGLVGVGMPDVRAGDQVTIWFGGPVPFVVRACEDGRTYKLVGAAYVAGIMEGQMVDELYCEDLADAITLSVK
ncbi:hypothetical protein LTR91_016717 [Friedmanniomyces endolithicus]|uniref:Heterokaryon incompatibility domain-containing protein n=1 Tax=Friedmanniomyces endolithicus TaxID=329885 RepID=A0AAN6J141_9PEZI|nr:hypothetical protein LTR35_015776 [Friedmanniomyces endolithicus]KAK0275822.1 hypothetical protein LTS00_014855 [Friedmanniomyces endolithicus]KAK0307831.1 hypothetical protein LTR82_015767 [Friedmanniomyces endolithicus]KAK0910856.1 hypothetical protein LTR57_015668 [Friedmanniomyces endolithicus]KAK0968459.1 hypothetical protein LTR91_016717 [Friedmanniomyces endolithicus]